MKYHLIHTDESPVTLDDAKKYLNVIHDHHDDIITRLIAAALYYCENFTGNAYRKQSFLLEASVVEMALGITFAKNPVSELKEITIDINGSAVTLDYNQYVFECSGSRSFIVIIDNKILRDADTNFNAVKILFDTDYSPVPAAIIQAILSLIAFLYENRGDAPSLSKTPLPSEILTVLEQDRVLFL